MTEKRERIVVRTAQGYDVLEGCRLNDEPLTRAAADRLAHEPVSATKNQNAPKGAIRNPAGEPTAKASKKPPAAPEPALSREEAMNRAAAKTFAEMDAANARPIPAAAYEVDPWLGVGGSAGFSCDGNLWSGKKPR
jgi:hypothetical protein